MSRHDRAFKNPFSDYNGEQLSTPDGKLAPELRQKVKECISRLLIHLQTGLQHMRKGDFSTYTGQTGIAMLCLHLSSTVADSDGERQNYLETTLGYLQPALHQLGSDVYSFLCGDAGVLAVAAVTFARVGASESSKKYVERLEQMHDIVANDPSVPDEHLYGRAGYLAAVMFVQSHLGEDVVRAQTIQKVVQAMLASGQRLSQRKGFKSPLMYAWYREYYLGAAHGLVGIFYTLLKVKDPQIRPQILELVRPSIDYLMTHQFPSGNYPAVIGDADDRLVHWCHGAPGWVSMFTLAYQTYNDQRYLEAAERCCEVIWHRGLLKKGYGLCHGAAGNAYAFLAMYQLTQDQKYLYRAYKFAEWCFDYGKHGCRVPDTPLSLFEGMAGTIYFLADLLDPLKARFPAYEV